MDAFFSGIAPRKHGQPLEPLATQTSRKKINARFEMWLNTYCTPVVPPNVLICSLAITLYFGGEDFMHKNMT